MIVELYLYLAAIAAAIISSFILLLKLRKFSSELPEKWQRSLSLKNFRLGISFLSIYLPISFISEIINLYLSRNGIYNHFVISIDYSLSTPFLFGFFLINTRRIWKRYAIIILYAIMIGYLTIGGYYHPRAVFPNTTSIFFDSLFFLATVLYLTDLLLNPQSDYFKFQLKINLSVLISSFLSAFITSIYWVDNPGSRIITTLCFLNQILFYFSLTCIFIIETLKLRRR